jgi:hypothetical protein
MLSEKLMLLKANTCKCNFSPKGKSPSSHWIRGWVGPRAGLDVVVKVKKIPSLPLLGNPDHPAHSPVTILSYCQS